MGRRGRDASVEDLEVVRLLHVVDRATAEAALGELKIIRAAHHDDRDRAPTKTHLLENIDPRHAGHLDVQQDNVGLVKLHHGQGVTTVVRPDDLIASMGEVLGHDIDAVWLVIDGEKSTET